jgi:hypothetical protein
MILADHQIHLHIAHPLLLLDYVGALVNIYTTFDLAPFSLQTAPFGVFLPLIPQTTVQPPTTLLVGPHVLVDPLSTRAFDTLPPGFSSNLFRAEVLFQLILHVRFYGSRKSLFLWLSLLPLVSLTLSQLGAIGSATAPSLLRASSRLTVDLWTPN